MYRDELNDKQIITHISIFIKRSEMYKDFLDNHNCDSLCFAPLSMGGIIRQLYYKHKKLNDSVDIDRISNEFMRLLESGEIGYTKHISTSHARYSTHNAINYLQSNPVCMMKQICRYKTKSNHGLYMFITNNEMLIVFENNGDIYKPATAIPMKKNTEWIIVDDVNEFNTVREKYEQYIGLK